MCGDHQEETGEAAGIHLVDQLPHRVEALFPDVAADTLQRLELVEHDQHSGVPRIAQDNQQPLKTAQGGEVVKVAAYTGRAAAAAATFG
ncbi:hypothetical protein [Salinispora arenicola]|uniref:hypothetical protein n=1 Tax=Salinispora arenicola TaxID=168697 RepID=UPI0027DAE768|nr:hypothetical protein [Salinispora arenicola]